MSHGPCVMHSFDSKPLRLNEIVFRIIKSTVIINLMTFRIYARYAHFTYPFELKTIWNYCFENSHFYLICIWQRKSVGNIRTVRHLRPFKVYRLQYRLLYSTYHTDFSIIPHNKSICVVATDRRLRYIYITLTGVNLNNL